MPCTRPSCRGVVDGAPGERGVEGIADRRKMTERMHLIGISEKEVQMDTVETPQYETEPAGTVLAGCAGVPRRSAAKAGR
ncbi:hypothetical protein ACFWJY_21135 [Streptomyces anulatus]|uniref:hypothetical protein n=1 Tax=Streptomyces anulatus TaxID=1892 RepID=UPI00364BBFB1